VGNLNRQLHARNLSARGPGGETGFRGNLKSLSNRPHLMHGIHSMRRIYLLIGLGCLLGAAWTAHAAGKTETRLLLSKEKASPGETVVAAVQLRMQPGWHTY